MTGCTRAETVEVQYIAFLALHTQTSYHIIVAPNSKKHGEGFKKNKIKFTKKPWFYLKARVLFGAAPGWDDVASNKTQG